MFYGMQCKHVGYLLPLNPYRDSLAEKFSCGFAIRLALQRLYEIVETVLNCTVTGWRLGYLAAPTLFTKAAAAIQSQSTSGACSISQHAGTAALNMGHAGGVEVRRMIDAFHKRRVSATSLYAGLWIHTAMLQHLAPLCQAEFLQLC